MTDCLAPTLQSSGHCGRGRTNQEQHKTNSAALIWPLKALKRWRIKSKKPASHKSFNPTSTQGLTNLFSTSPLLGVQSTRRLVDSSDVFRSRPANPKTRCLQPSVFGQAVPHGISHRQFDGGTFTTTASSTVPDTGGRPKPGCMRYDEVRKKPLQFALLRGFFG